MTDLSTRYGAPRPLHRGLLTVVVTLAVAAALGWLVWTFVEQGDPEVTSDIVSFDIVDEHTATATFRVSRRTSTVEASCLLRAQASDHTTVGEVNVAVGPGGDEVRTLTGTVRTEREATTVDVVGCVAEGQTHRR